ncbi:MAG: DNA primase [Prevotella sp.]|nr:DNA primase [Prevotella sp.]
MIDRETVERIKGTANIVEVVSDFVTLRKSGAGYKGLCPFHNERTPSFVVTPARGTYHCFGCGRGGNAVDFVIEHEQLTYPEALRWLAKKYGIEVVEKEMTDKERQEQNEREAMFIVNEWAAGYFEDLLRNNEDGKALGMQYFRARGFRDDVISRYRLGYDLRNRFALAAAAKRAGYKDEYLLKTGLCYQTDRGELIDRFADRVVFPWIGLSGKVVGFSARLLDMRTKGVNQKYVNSPDSDIYHKEKELFGIYQAKKAIAKEDRVYIVEGQTDVLSMAQCGIENVVANSGTALSVNQINILHRLTDNITLLYDGDEAGIHAALRGTDMLLSEGMNVRILLLPDGDDPDSYARKHTANDFREYVGHNQKDFIQFKTSFLLGHTTDPQQRSEAVDEIVKSVAVVPNPVLRDTYLHGASVATGVKEITLINRMNGFIRERKQGAPAAGKPVTNPAVSAEETDRTAQIERMIARLVVRQGEQIAAKNVIGKEGKAADLTLAQFVYQNLDADGLRLSNDVYQSILEETASHAGEPGFAAGQYLANHDDITIARTAMNLLVDKYDRMAEDDGNRDGGTEKTNGVTGGGAERLRKKAGHLLLDFRMDYVEKKLRDLTGRMTAPGVSDDEKREMKAEYISLHGMRNQLARMLAQNVI